MNNELQAIIIFGVAIVLTVASLILSQVYQDRGKEVISCGFAGLALVFGSLAVFSAVCVIGTIWPQS